MHTRSNETIHKLKLYSTKVIVKSEIIFSPKLKKCQTRPIYAQQSKNYKHTTISSVDGRRGGLTSHDGWRENAIDRERHNSDKMGDKHKKFFRKHPYFLKLF